jgi:hypothetical protein
MQIIRPWKELDLQSLYIRRIDLVIKGYSEHPLAYRAPIAGLTRRQNRHDIVYAIWSQFYKGKVV